MTLFLMDARILIYDKTSWIEVLTTLNSARIKGVYGLVILFRFGFAILILEGTGETSNRGREHSFVCLFVVFFPLNIEHYLMVGLCPGGKLRQ